MFPLATLSFLALAAAPPPARLATASFRAIQVEPQKADFFGTFFAQQLAEASGLPVTTPEELTAVLGLERQKQLMGCSSESASCLAEIAAGMGVDGLVLGSVARVGEGWALAVKVVAAKDASPIAALTAQLATEGEVLPWLTKAARQMGPTVRARLAPGAGPAPSLATASVSRGRFVGSGAWVPTAVAVVCLATGGLLYGLSVGRANSISGGDMGIHTLTELQNSVAAGRTMNIAGGVLLAAGAVALVTAGALLLFNKPADSPSVAVVAAEGGGALVFGGRF